MQPPNSSDSSSSVTQTSEPAKQPRAKRLRRIFRVLSPLMRLPFLGGLGRTTWLILALGGLVGFSAGSFWAHTTAIEAAAPARFSWSWWTTSLEIHRELQLASFGDEEIESVAVVRTPAGNDRILVAGRNALLAFSDDAGRTWTRVLYDPLMGGFAVAGKRAPFPDTSGISVATPPSNTGAKPAAAPAANTPSKTAITLPRTKQNATPVQQYKPQQQNAPPPAKKPAAKSAASLSFLPSIIPVVWAAVETPPKPSAAQGTTVDPAAAVNAARNTGALQPQPVPQGIPAICRADNGALVLVMSGERAAISLDYGETWQSTSLAALIEQAPDNFSLGDFWARKAFPSGKQPSRLETRVARLTGRLGDTFLSSKLLEDQPVHPRAAFISSSAKAWAVSDPFTGDRVGSGDVIQTGPDRGTLYSVRIRVGSTGATWQETRALDRFAPRDIAFSSDGSIGYLVGTHGVILQSRNAGGSWPALTREALHPGQTLSTAQAGESYWRLPPPWTSLLLLLFLGSLGAAIVISAVPGANTLMEAAEGIASPDLVEGPLTGVALITVSDRPLGEDDADRLGFRSIARGVAGFLRNPKTQLPVTLAINGAWGTGKSSLMNLICGELRRARFRPVWFNAWHHQEDENLLASLLQSVRQDAAPPVLGKGGLAFRFRLGWFRFYRLYPRALAMVAIFIGLWAAESWIDQKDNAVYLKRYFAEKLSPAPPAPSAGKPQEATGIRPNAPAGTSQPAITAAASPASPGKPDSSAGGPAKDSGNWIDSLMMAIEGLHDSSDSLTKGLKLPRPLAALYFLLQIFPAALKKLKAFATNPASLLHSAAPGVPTSQIEAQTSFRMRFAKEFADVTRALGEKHRLVIFVDDLDRCRPAHVAEMMEAINYVTVAGECVFVLGIETEAVRAALGLSFDAMAQEVESKRNVIPGPVVPLPVNQEDSPDVKRRNRDEFARRYVEKLINIEMNVPQLDVRKKEALFAVEQAPASARDPFERARKIGKVGRLLEPAAAFLLVLALGWGAGRFLVRLAEWQAQDYFQDQAANAKAVVPANAVAPPPTAAGENPQAAAPANPSPAAAQGGDGKTPEVLPGEDPLPAAMLQNPLAWIVIALAILGIIQSLARVPIPPAKDSQDFARALAAWGWVASDGLETPRAAKRFLNRLRFLAMRQHPPSVQLPGLMKLLLTAEEQKHALQQEEAKAAGFSVVQPIPEAILVALASLEAYPKGTGLSAPAIGTTLDNLSQFASNLVAAGDFRSAPFLAELARTAYPASPPVPQFDDTKAMNDFFVSLSGTGSLINQAKDWSTRATTAIQGYLNPYFDLGGDVEFT